ncbi:MAG: sugar ABC transporter permease [Hamadaea sp.]|uniref:carbohydrate ABC transporter permease n=1 Tax=Hamadaea sp. TaxID=2024425 RepID=UPI0017A18B2D|nr:sugar ABC transporter permease [Hamadaea sp.]NUR72109.1 sugar ABC transporter permease [Hamadaea sp.]NUT22944.1 sugar ABC transporter permease [Hamadaea sp.]
MRRSTRRGVRRWLPGLILVSPSLLALGVFVYYFIGWNGYYSLTNWKGLAPPDKMVGLDNYKQLLSNDETFRNDVRNLVVFTVVFMVGSLLLGLFMALLMDKGVRGEGVLRAIFLFPMAISFIATGIIWRWLLNSDSGAGTTGINKLFDVVGLGFLHSDWHKSDSSFAIASLALPAGWALSGYVMALFLAGLRGIPEELREAARVDGASELRVYWHVVRPLLLPVLMSAVVILAHISLKTFDLIYAIDPGGPRTETPALYMWLTSFRGGFFARGASIATMLFGAIALVVIPYIWYSMRQERR